jgi:putative endonuclease
VNKNWKVYIVECSDGTYYTGITNDIQRRILEHNYGSKSAKYTRSRRPVRLIYSESVCDRSAASRREYKIKKMKRPEKGLLVESDKNEFRRNS